MGGPAEAEEVEEAEEAEEAEEEEEEGGEEVKAYWVLYIDLLFVSYDGNPFDAAWAAMLAALRDTRLPRARWDPDREAVVCARASAPLPLRLRGLPVACTAAIFTARQKRHQHQHQGKRQGQDAYWVLVDPDRFEEGLCDESVTVVVDRTPAKGMGLGGETKVLGISKSGGTVVGPQVLRRFVDIAEERWQVFRDALGS